MSVKGYAKFESSWVRRLLKSPLAAVGSHWIFQSLFYMDGTERRFKLGLNLALTIVFWLLFRQGLPRLTALLPAFLAAHTLNFLLNGHLWGALKHYGYVENSYDAFSAYTDGLAKRTKANQSIIFAAVYGSRVRGEWKATSDLDVRLVRRPGVWHGFRACWFCLSERTRALFSQFPLDIYVLDNKAGLGKLRRDEIGAIVKDAD